jgi:N-acetylmuramoyl-L-alanine amidase
MCVKCDVTRRGFARLALGAAAGLTSLRAARADTKAKPLIMLDPGHGGHDPGAIAPDGVYEKHLTLATGMALRGALLASGRYRVAMTRSRDIFISLEDRVADAMNAKADLFLALHCDHLPDSSLRGASVFTLADNASDALAASVADDENSVQSGGPIAGVSPQVANILASLETRATKIGSMTLAQDIEATFRGVVPLLPDPHRSANFAVLRDPSTPATLLEMGCLTNALDEKRLRSPARRKEMVQRLVHAMDLYFANNAAQRVAG